MAEIVPTLRFGAELELVLHPYDKFELFPLKDAEMQECGGDKDKINCQKLANIIQAVSGELKAIRGDSKAAEQAKMDGTYYQNWTVVKDPSIQSGKDEWGVEIVSRALSVQEDWVKEVSMVWGVITEYFQVRSSDSCSTHVHVSRFTHENNYLVQDLRRIVKGVAYWDPSVRQFVPQHRRENEFALSNIQIFGKTEQESHEDPGNLRTSYRDFVGQNFKALFAKIEKLDKGQDNELVTIAKFAGSERYLGYNFQNIWFMKPETQLKKPTGTIEFRLPPQSLALEDTCHWITFATSFIEGSVQEDIAQSAAISESIIPDNNFKTLKYLNDFGSEKAESFKFWLNNSARNLNLGQYLTLDKYK